MPKKAYGKTYEKREIRQVKLLAVNDNSQLQMSLRPRGHSFNLPRYQYNLTRKSVVFRNLYLHK